MSGLSGKIRRFLLQVLVTGILTLVLVVSGLAQEKAGKDQPIPRVEEQPAAEKPEGMEVGVRVPEAEAGAPCAQSEASPQKSRIMKKRTDRIGGQVIRAQEGEEEQK